MAVQQEVANWNEAESDESRNQAVIEHGGGGATVAGRGKKNGRAKRSVMATDERGQAARGPDAAPVAPVDAVGGGAAVIGRTSDGGEVIIVAPTLYLVFELSDKTWRLLFSNGTKYRNKSIRAGDLAALEAEITRARERLRLPADVTIRSCYEAGREGFWLHRWLDARGVLNEVIDSASIEVDRRRRRTKTDRVDAEKLMELLSRRWRLGEKKGWRVCRVPSQEEEDLRQGYRERLRLQKEGLALTSHIQSLLRSRGVFIKHRQAAWLTLTEVVDYAGQPLPPRLVADLQRTQERLLQVLTALDKNESEWRERLYWGDSQMAQMAKKLMSLKGIGLIGAWGLVAEFFGWRTFPNGKAVGAAAGLTGTPYDSGVSMREQGISKAGNPRVRSLAVQLAWMWVRLQPNSELTKWFKVRFANGTKRQRRCGIVAVARKLLIALWRWLEFDEMPAGAEVKQRPTKIRL